MTDTTKLTVEELDNIEFALCKEFPDTGPDIIAAARNGIEAGWLKCPDCGVELRPVPPKSETEEQDGSSPTISTPPHDGSYWHEPPPVASPSGGLRSEPVPSGEGWYFVRNNGDRSLWQNEDGAQEWFLVASPSNGEGPTECVHGTSLGTRCQWCEARGIVQTIKRQNSTQP